VLLTSPSASQGENYPVLLAARAELVEAGVHERYLDPMLDAFRRAALPFADDGADMRAMLRQWIAARLPVARDWKARAAGHTVVLVGQSGVGKTTTACKLAGRMSAAGMRVALVAAGQGSHQALEAHARMLGVEAILAEDAESLLQARKALADRDLVVVDTTGRSHQDLDGIEDLAALLGPARPDEVHLVLPVTSSLADLGDVTRRFRIAGVNRVSVTKLDETRFHGNLVNFPLRVGKPLGFVTDGTSVPGALRPADALLIAEMLLP
jgi:flagellar biosynthesis protein FlhF